MERYTAIQSEQDQKRIQKKARRWSLLLLLLFLILAFLPFMSSKLQVKQKFNQVVMVDFDDSYKEFKDAAAAKTKKSSAKKANAKKSNVIEQVVSAAPEKPEVKQDVKEPTPEPKPEAKPEAKKPVTKPTPKPDFVPLPKSNKRPVLTAPSPEIKMSDLLKDISKTAHVEEVSEEVVEVTEELSDDFMKDIVASFKKSKKKQDGGGGSKSDSDGDDAGQTSDGGEGDSGSSDSGDADTDGSSDEGDSDADGDSFDGDGLLTRKVIHRANINSLIKETGKIVINLCVNRDGKVVYAKADGNKCTITDPVLLKKAEFAAAKYRYEKDYSVAEKQCGVLSFLVKIEK